MPLDKTLLSDQPISSPHQDLLHRRSFVAGLRHVLASWDPSASLVLGLSAPWGEGKTSVLNLLESSLSDDNINVIRFNPWEWADKDRLLNTFFDELSMELGHISRIETEEIAKKLRRYAARLGGSADAASIPTSILKWFLTLSAAVSIWSITFPARSVRLIGIVLLCIATLAIWSKKLLRATADVLSPDGKDLQPSLETLKRELSTQLASWSGRILIVLDDLDRLSPEATADIIRLVKANGDLPRICYLLVGDRNVIDDHISKKLSVDGSAFMEKIIQFSFALPALDNRTLRTIFFAELDKIVASDKVNKSLDGDHWTEIFWCIDPFLTNLRAVKRFAQTIRFHVEMLTGYSAFEANVADLIGIEAIRVFKPSLYSRVKANKSILASGSTSSEAHGKLTEMLEGISGDELRQCERLLKALFPIMEATGDTNYGVDVTRGWTASGRICSTNYFDRYFQFAVPADDLSDSDLQFFFEHYSRDECRKRMTEIANWGLLEVLVDRLRAKTKSIQKTSISPLVISLCDLGDRLATRSQGMFGLAPISTAQFAVEEILRSLQKQQPEALAEIFENTDGMRLPIEILLRLARLKNEGRLDFELEDSKMETWRARFIRKIAVCAEDRSLFKSESANFFLQVWELWGGADAGKATIRALTSSREGALIFLRSVINISRVSDQSGLHDRPYIRYGDVSRFVDPDELYKALQIDSDVDAKMLSLEHPEFDHFQRARTRFSKGISDDGFGTWDEVDE